jgi:hypothetical protein
MAQHRRARMCSGSPKRAPRVMGFQVTEVQKSLKGFDYREFPEDLAGHAESNGGGSDLVGALRSLQKESFDGPNAVMHSLSEDGVLSGSTSG